jgi:hypothetical protein
MKYLTQVKFRLVDNGKYLNEGDVYDPMDSAYESSSRSLAAALKAGWLKMISDEDAAKIQAEKVKKLMAVEPVEIKKVHVDPNQTKAISRKINSDVEVATPNVGLGEVTDEDMADEVIHQEPIIAAMESRRQAKRQSQVQQPREVEVTAESIKSEIKRKVRKSLRIDKRKK